MVAAYAAVCDGNGVVPLTDDLIYMIKNCAEQMGWFEIDAAGNGVLTADQNGNPTGVTAANLVKENAYLFVCCYVNEFVHGGDTSITLVPGEEQTANAIAKQGETLKFKANAAMTLLIKDAQGLTVTYNGKTYTADANGEIAVTMSDAKPAFTVSAQTTREFTLTYVSFLPE